MRICNASKLRCRSRWRSTRQQVLVAFAEVEESHLRTFDEQTHSTRDALASASRASRIAQVRYQAGATNYLDVIDAQRTLLTVQCSDVQIRGAYANSTLPSSARSAVNGMCRRRFRIAGRTQLASRQRRRGEPRASREMGSTPYTALSTTHFVGRLTYGRCAASGRSVTRACS